MHEKCRDQIQEKDEEVQHPYHPQHRLSARLEYDKHDECTSLKNANSDTEEKSDDEESSIEQLSKKDSGSEDSSSDDQVEIHEKHIEERSIEQIPQEETPRPDINAKIANIYAEMEALVTELDDVRATKLQSIISSYKEEIMSTSRESSR